MPSTVCSTAWWALCVAAFFSSCRVTFFWSVSWFFVSSACWLILSCSYKIYNWAKGHTTPVPAASTPNWFVSNPGRVYQPVFVAIMSSHICLPFGYLLFHFRQLCDWVFSPTLGLGVLAFLHWSLVLSALLVLQQEETVNVLFYIV